MLCQCGKLIEDGEEYFCLSLQRAIYYEKNEIEVKSDIQIATWCKDCWTEQTQLIKTDT